MDQKFMLWQYAVADAADVGDQTGGGYFSPTNAVAAIDMDDALKQY